MLEYTLITILLIAWAWQTWRKRVWKKRAKANYLGFWGMVHKEMQGQLYDFSRNTTDGQLTYGRINDGYTGIMLQTDKWPDTIDDK